MPVDPPAATAGVACQQARQRSKRLGSALLTKASMGSTPRPAPCLPVLHPSGTGLVLHAAVLGRCWLPRRYLTLVKADGSEDPQGVQCSRVAVCAAARSKLANPGQCGALLFEERAVLSRQASLQRAAGALCVCRVRWWG